MGRLTLPHRLGVFSAPMRHAFASLGPTLAALVLSLGVGCGDDAPPPPGTVDGGATACRSHRDCDDGVYCNGAEACDPSASSANARGCRPGAPPCAIEVCDEARARCADTCLDVDGDGHADVRCGGDDCDDSDPGIHPDATEVCDAEGIDEDCDPSTLGGVDRDDDGFVDDACCNGDRCGDDCDDDVANVHRTAPEVCDGVDQDCDGRADEGVVVLAWPDVDGDGYGDDSEDPEPYCELPSGAADRGGDCDDGRDDVSPREVERCNGRDDDCDGTIDDGTDAACQATMPPGTIGGCFAPADGSPPSCRALACEPTYFDCNANLADGCEQALCSSRTSCDRCGRSCGLGCDLGICAGLEERFTHEFRVSTLDGAPVSEASVTLVDTCRATTSTTDTMGLASVVVMDARQARATADGHPPGLFPFDERVARGVLVDDATIDAWYAAMGLTRDADKGTLIVVVRDRVGSFGIDGATVLLPTVSGPSFRVFGDTVEAATTLGFGALVFPNVTPGLFTVELDAGPACSWLCSDGHATSELLVEPGALTSFVLGRCYMACA